MPPRSSYSCTADSEHEAPGEISIAGSLEKDSDRKSNGAARQLSLVQLVTDERRHQAHLALTSCCEVYESSRVTPDVILSSRRGRELRIPPAIFEPCSNPERHRK